MIELLYLFMPIMFDHSYFVLLVRCYLLKYDSSTCLNYDRAALLVYAYHVLVFLFFFFLPISFCIFYMIFALKEITMESYDTSFFELVSIELFSFRKVILT